ncbi:Uncharacterised protein [uncultured archaeon]|nr:Uncharacterised protein [uncultured archaeon]
MKRILMLIGLCLIVSGCLGQTDMQDNQQQQNNQQIQQDNQQPPQQPNAGPQPPYPMHRGNSSNYTRDQFPGGPIGANMTQELIKLCAGKNPGDTCDVTFGNRTRNGTCQTEQTGELTCTINRTGQRPGNFTGRPPRPDGNMNPQDQPPNAGQPN